MLCRCNCQWQLGDIAFDTFRVLLSAVVYDLNFAPDNICPGFQKKVLEEGTILSVTLNTLATPTSSKAKHIIVWWLVSNFRFIWCLIYGENAIFEIHFFLIWITPHENCLTPKTGRTKCYKWIHGFRWRPWIYLNKRYEGRSQQKRIHKFGTVCCIHVYIKDSKYICSAFHCF